MISVSLHGCGEGGRDRSAAVFLLLLLLRHTRILRVAGGVTGTKRAARSLGTGKNPSGCGGSFLLAGRGFLGGGGGSSAAADFAAADLGVTQCSSASSPLGLRHSPPPALRVLIDGREGGWRSMNSKPMAL